MYSIDLAQVWVDTIGIVEAAKEIDSLGLHMCLLWVEHQVIFVGNMHKISQVGIMFHLGAAVYSDVVCDSDTSLAFFEDLIHLSLEDVLGTDQSKGKLQEMVPSEGTVESCKQAGVLVEYDWPVFMVGIQLSEEARVCELMSDFLYGGHLVMIMADGLIEVTGIQAQM